LHGDQPPLLRLRQQRLLILRHKLVRKEPGHTCRSASSRTAAAYVSSGPASWAARPLGTGLPRIAQQQRTAVL
jgi:hypothetical protein